MQSLSRKLMLAIACLLFNVLYAEAGLAEKVQPSVSEGSQLRGRMTSLSQPHGIAVDRARGKLYWTDPGTHKIYSANIDGSGLETVVTWAPNPRGIAVDKGKIYWTDSRTRQIYRANLDGSQLEVLIAGMEDNLSSKPAAIVRNILSALH